MHISCALVRKIEEMKKEHMLGFNFDYVDGKYEIGYSEKYDSDSYG